MNKALCGFEMTNRNICQQFSFISNQFLVSNIYHFSNVAILQILVPEMLNDTRMYITQTLYWDNFCVCVSNVDHYIHFMQHKKRRTHHHYNNNNNIISVMHFNVKTYFLRRITSFNNYWLLLSQRIISMAQQHSTTTRRNEDTTFAALASAHHAHQN